MLACSTLWKRKASETKLKGKGEVMLREVVGRVSGLLIFDTEYINIYMSMLLTIIGINVLRGPYCDK